MPLSWNEIKVRTVAFNQRMGAETSKDAESKPFWYGFLHIFDISRRRVASWYHAVEGDAGCGVVADGLMEIF